MSSSNILFCFAFVFLFVNAIGAARKWYAGEPGWAGAYAASFVMCILLLKGHYA